MSYDENHKPYSVETRNQFMQKRKPRHIPGNLPVHKNEPAARLECLRLVSGNRFAVDDLFRLVPLLCKLNISGMRTRLERGRPLTPTQFYRYMNRY